MYDYVHTWSIPTKLQLTTTQLSLSEYFVVIGFVFFMIRADQFNSRISPITRRI